ncbi:peptide chain release factor 3 [Ruania alkalisoli]|uniref:Peptide chain release factor 3 n=1 Tax=Ruania alkalisoli TaxID=2779775 RepID=A0A7M1STT1_9MICO|nr:peptide chain release factor 3 [Ruania alkalisoli]QOR70988.1 peptide chain release factor 3 [Ruania alkalisoli]
MQADGTSLQDIAAEAHRRRTIAVISHPDAGKSTLTEALALHAQVIGEAGAVHGKGNRSGVVSDWLEMERKRGISITSAALQFAWGDLTINLLDTPGHADFSEDTYRVLTAVDCAVMLIDSAKGLEPQTFKLFEVCKRRNVPVIAFINKWDRPGREALELIDEITERLDRDPQLVTWPVGIGGSEFGLLDVASGEVHAYRKAPGGAQLAEDETLDPPAAAQHFGGDDARAREEAGLLPVLDSSAPKAAVMPILFGAALSNIGVRQLFETIDRWAPAPGDRPTRSGDDRPVIGAFSGFVFKMQAGMDPKHRDHVAYVRVCSGVFERGMILTHQPTKRAFATKYALSIFGRDREVTDRAYPGDVVGLVNAANLAVGDTLYDPEGPAVEFPPMPAFEPEHFASARVADPSASKKFRRGMDKLVQEGVVQRLVSDLRGDGNPILAAVGPLQFEVAADRMEHEFGARLILDTLPYSLARKIDEAGASEISGMHGVEIARRHDGTRLALLRDIYLARSIGRTHPDVTLTPLLADAT